MRRLTLMSLMTTSALLLSGCNPSAMMQQSHGLDVNLPKMYGVKYMVDNTAVGFEWQPLYEQHIDGINIYRSEAYPQPSSGSKQLTKIATINSPFASHYVDSNLQENSNYTYTFTTIRGDYESVHGQMIELRTLAPLPQVGFFQGKQYTNNVIKLIWRPHEDKRVKRYRIERAVNDSQTYNIIGNVESRLMSEYVDNYVTPNNTYIYRVQAIGFDGSTSIPSQVVIIKTVEIGS
ncbi:MAG: hypothetical protein IE889_00745 [Campylobacterales bacterium]|nr:hypothetical protein [Campylobacterales bacterium]